jgi:hypothetical protein
MLDLDAHDAILCSIQVEDLEKLAPQMLLDF